ncbi:MAG: hypothetical protein O8C64_03580 [Candidatus Methanoperedens sp.]|nr:hypothetical protein [Candidatus Methanoperedens sp.]
MNWGMKNRISRIIKPKTGRCVMLAVDHGYFQGPTTGLSNLGKTVEPLLPYADALMITRGAIRNTCSVYVGGEYEKETIDNLSKLVDEGEKYGIPVLAVTAVGKEMARDARYLGLASRICVEIGAHMIKTYYTEDFGKVVEACGNVPVVIAGGKKLPEMEALQMAYNAVSDGAVGVDMGRNIFQSDSPVGMIQAVRAIVHEGKSADEAYGIYEQSKK